ncbi:phytoene desaturase family protein [Zafaria sp. J156]|uniref:phytoene desaturase family protein n=1 Tax=Zafaria sp. J156 TaxID=3116490 RepID=UPI002E794D47|nr:phytoene desaturase family protein [Zafaria sp. J156]MEE1620944.1 phytoene desaturase family protein [Zafaria sp. J156]
MSGPGSVVVIGAGFAGLATAGLLAAAGHRVTVLEQHPVPGGRAGRIEDRGFRFDTGPSWYLMPDVIDHWFRLMGSSAAAELDLVRLDPGYRTWFEGSSEPLDLTAGPRALEAFDRLSSGAGPALRRYLDDARESHDLALGHFLYEDFATPSAFLRPEVLRRAPRLAGLLAGSLEGHVARRFADPRMRQVLGYPAVFLGSSPARTPALYHLMSHLDLGQGVLYPQGGFAALVDAMVRLVEGAGVRLVTEARARRILTARRGAARARVTGVQYDDGAGTVRTIAADTVVAAADLHHVETALLPAELRTHPERRWRRRDPGPSAVLAMLGVRGPLPELAHHNLLFTRDWADNFGRIHAGRPLLPETSMYVCRPSATDPSVAPAGHENLFLLVPAPARPDWGRGGVDGTGDPAVEAVADAAVDQLAAWAGIKDLRGRITVRHTRGPADFAETLNAWRGSALGPAHTLAQSAFLRPGNRSRRVDGLHYAGSSVRPGIGVPMCLISAEVTARAVMGLAGGGRLPEPAGRAAP